MTTEDAWREAYDTDRTLDEDVLETLLDSIYDPSIYQFLNEEALERVQDAVSYYDYYDLEGQVWSTPANLGYDPTILTVNLGRYLVKKRAAWLFEVAPDIECPPEQFDPPEEMEETDYKPSKKQARLNAQAATRESLQTRRNSC